MHSAVVELLGRCGTHASVLPPTELYNEGWLLRLVLDWLDRNRAHPHVLAFEPGARWFSEALLSSRFLPTARRDLLAESFTHADGVIGHFEPRAGQRGDAVLAPDAHQFIVIEAKLGSPLSSGTKNAAQFDQAARNVACIAHMLADPAISQTSIKRLGFYVLAPQVQVAAGVFGQLVTKESIHAKVAQRVASYEGKHDQWFQMVFVPTLERIELGILAWEQVLGAIAPSAARDALWEFYGQCLKFNTPRHFQSLR